MRQVVKKVMHIPVTVFPHKIVVDGKQKITGYYVHVGSLFPRSSMKSDAVQFVGVHKSMCFTLDRPKGVDSVLRLAEVVPTVCIGQSSKKVPIQWLGKVRCYAVGDGFKLYLPNKVWSLPRRGFGQKVVTTAEVVRIPVREGKAFMIMTIPALTREKISR